MRDPIFGMIENERIRQENTIELIASENFVSDAVLEAQGSILTNKYSEGYPGKRYYGGCEFIDHIESATIERAKMLFGVEYANVQPHSGSQANQATYMALLDKGDTILSMSLNSGGHLTHGSPVSSVGKDYNIVSYGLDEFGIIDYEEVEKLAVENKPKLIVAGASAYSRKIDFKEFSRIAKLVGAKLMVDMAHIAGLVAAGIHESPVGYADVITTTTHKTLRGPRGGMILTNDTHIAKKVNSAIFPGIQGGPLQHVIAAKGVALYEAMCPEFIEYSRKVVSNAKAMEIIFEAQHIKMVSGGTDNHLLLLDVYDDYGITGKALEQKLESIGITVNKNAIPNDKLSPHITSGIRIGTPAMTTKGLGSLEFTLIAGVISRIIKGENPKKFKRYVNKIVRSTK